MESFVISVSLGTGCYRHIQISANATLYKLHQAILKAFEFEDDHEHAFFMDNHVWSSADAYFSSKAESGDRLTKKYTLKKLKLTKGQKFKYVFDFGDEWEFQCKVLRELEEDTKTPLVIRSVGESPEQYPEWEEYEEDAEEDDEDDIPDSLTQEEIEKLYAQIPLTREEINRIHLYMDAAANLYGLISLDELYGLYNSQNEKVDVLPFLMAVGVIDQDEDNDFIVIERTDNSQATAEESMKNCEIVSDYLFVEDPERDIRELSRAQKGKPLKILPKAEFLRFADSTYFPETPQRSAMTQYLRKLSASLPTSAAEYCDCIQNLIVIDAPLQDILSILKEDGLTSNKNWDLEEFAILYQGLNNHTHKHANRGNTPDDLFAQSSRGLQLRQRLAPSEDQLSFFEEPPRKPKLTIVGTPSRNGPCPCGSGKKYKNCCGKEKE